MKPFGISIQGRVKNFNIPQNQPLLPVFEAIVNAFHAIDERRGKDHNYCNPSITIEIEREGQLSLIDSAERNPIQSITVSDNGIGFDVNNFKSFLESDSSQSPNFCNPSIRAVIRPTIIPMPNPLRATSPNSESMIFLNPTTAAKLAIAV